jgi:hypothetical protein
MRNQELDIRTLGSRRGGRVRGLRWLRMTAQAVLVSMASAALCGPSAAQNVEGQIVASQYATWKVLGYAPDTYSGFAPAACRVQGGASFFPAFSMGTAVRIVDSNPRLSEVVTPSAVVDDGSACSVTIHPAHHHQTPFYFTSATAGLQEAINANIAIPGPNTIVLTNQWYQLGGSAAVIASVHGAASLGLVDVTQVPTKWYQWNGSAYVAVDTSGCNGGCVTQINGTSGPVNLVSGSNVSITRTGNSITVSTAGSAGSGNVAAANQYSCGMYPNSGTNATIGGAANCYILPTGLSTSQINTILGGVGAATIQIPNGDAHTPFTNPNNVRIDDRRTDIPTEMRSVKEWGAQCDTRGLQGTTSTTGGVSTVTLSGNVLSGNDVGDLVIGVGTYAGLPAYFSDPIASVTSGSTATLAYALPFDITNQQQLTVGHDDTSSIGAAIAAQVAASGQNNISLSLPVGNCLVHHNTQTPQTFIGRSKAFSRLTGFPGEPVLTLAGGFWQGYRDFAVYVDSRIDSTRPYNYFDTAGAMHAGTVYYQPWGLRTAHANDPTAQGWFIGGFNGAASVSSGSRTITVTSANVPAAGQTIVFPYLSSIFTTTVSTVSGSTVTLAANYAGATSSEVEWFAGSSPQHLASAMPATGHAAKITSWSSTGSVATFKAQNAFTAGQVVTLTGFPSTETLDEVQVTVLSSGLSSTQFQANLTSSPGFHQEPGFAGLTITLANPIYPSPYNESNVAAHGAVKIDGEECLYEGVHRSSPYQIILSQCSMNGTTEAAHAVNATIVPMNAWKWDSMPWPVTPTIHTTAPTTTTPVGAEYFPAGNVGAYGIGSPWPDGAAGGAVGSPFEGHLENLLIQTWENVSFGHNNDASFFWAAPPYESHFSNIDMYNQSCFIEATSGIHTHEYNSYNPTGDGATTDTMSCRANFDGAIADFISGGQQYHSNWASYGGTGGMGFNVSFGWDDQSGNLATEVYDSTFTNIYLESGGLLPHGEVLSELDCLTCWWYGIGTGNSTFIGGSNQQFFGGNLASTNNDPAVNYGPNTAFHEVLGPLSTTTSNTYGLSSFLNYGANISGCALIPGISTNDGCITPGVGSSRRPSQGQSGETFSTGNLTAPYVDSIDGFITPSGIGSWTFDDTAPITHSYWSCGTGTNPQVYCENVSQFIGNGNGGGQLVPGQYDLIGAFKATSGAAQTLNFSLIAYQSGLPTAPYCTAVGGSGQTPVPINGNSSVIVPISTTWAKVDLGKVDLSSYSGCGFGMHFNQVSTTPTTVETAFIDLAPIWEGPTAQKITLNQTTPADNATCKPGTFLGSDTNYIYVCTASGTVKRAALSAY